MRLYVYADVFKVDRLRRKNLAFKIWRAVKKITDIKTTCGKVRLRNLTGMNAWVGCQRPRKQLEQGASTEISLPTESHTSTPKNRNTAKILPP